MYLLFYSCSETYLFASFRLSENNIFDAQLLHMEMNNKHVRQRLPLTTVQLCGCNVVGWRRPC